MTQKTYRATADGFLSSESRLVHEGEVFSTDEIISTKDKPCTWAEEISNAEAKRDAKAEDKLIEAEKDRPDGSGVSAPTLNRK